MQIGTIKTWMGDRGFGFIRNDDGSGDVFAHINNFADGLEPKIGLRVEFDLVQDERSGKTRADNVMAA